MSGALTAMLIVASSHSIVELIMKLVTFQQFFYEIYGSVHSMQFIRIIL